MSYITLLFYIVFLSQILLLSNFYPQKIQARMKRIMDNFPPETYPKLYPKSLDYYKTSWARYKFMNQATFVMGMMLFTGIAVWENQSGGQVSQMVPWAYFMIQMGPLMYLEVSEFSCFKQMRKIDMSTTRKAELNPRRFFDMISPPLFLIAVLLFAGAVICNLYINDFDLTWGGQALPTILIMSAGNLFFAGIIFWNIYGKKLDPYQTSGDRLRLIKVTVKSLVYVSMGVSIFIVTTQLINEFNLDVLEPMAMSIYLQLIAFASIGGRLQALDVEDFNLDVYKADAAIK